LVCRFTVQTNPEKLSQLLQPAKVEVPVGDAVSTMEVPAANELLQVVELELVQLRPGGELLTVPVPVPVN
jgi:hypothetical protein